MRSLEQTLVDYPVVLLTGIASVHGVELRGTNARAIAQELAEYLTQPAVVVANYAACSVEAQAALNALRAGGGKAPRAACARRHGDIRPMGPGRLQREEPWKAPQTPSEELYYRGLVGKTFAIIDGVSTEFLYIPADLLPWLPEPQDITPAISIEPIDPPGNENDRRDAVVEDMASLLIHISQHPPRLYRGQEWAQPEVRALGRRLLQPVEAPDALQEPGGYMQWLLHLAQSNGWLRPVGPSLRLDGARLEPWLRNERLVQWHTLFELWRDDAAWNDLCRCPEVECEGGNWHNDPVGTRQRFLQLLRHLEAGSWYRRADFVRAVKEVAPDFQRPDGDYDTWYVRSTSSQEYLLGFEHWDAVEGTLIRYYLEAPLYWLGVVGRGSLSPAAEQRFSLTRVGSAWLHEEPPDAHPIVEQKQATVQPDFVILVQPGVSVYDRWRISRFTEWLEGGPPWRFRITQRALSRAAHAGIIPERIVAFLRTHCAELPENIERALVRWRPPEH